MPLPSPRMERDAEGFLIMEEPPAVSTKYDGREWSLEVPQQPIRARMCGFGDKVRGHLLFIVELLTRHRIGDRSLHRRVSG